MGNPTWDAQWKKMVEDAYADSDRHGGSTYGRNALQRPAVMVYTDGNLLVDSRRNRPGDYLWSRDSSIDSSIELPVFRMPLRGGCIISVIRAGGTFGLMRDDYFVMAKTALAGAPVEVKRL